jgi:hypothetical protein
VNVGKKIAKRQDLTPLTPSKTPPLKQATASNVLHEEKFGGQQKDGTIAFGFKGSLEAQVGPVVAGVELRAGLQSTVGGGDTGGFVGGQGVAKRNSSWGVSVQYQADVFNWSYKK